MIHVLSMLLLLAGEVPHPPDAADVSAAEPSGAGRFVIHVITMGPGDPLFARFGHIGLVVEDRRRGTRTVFNYGTFNFADPDLQFEYVKGYLTYWLSVAPFGSTVRLYRARNRSVVVRTLNLTPEQAAEVAHRLAVNARPENREYDYRHYMDNCCTRVRDIIDEVTGGAVSAGKKDEPTGRTFRTWTRRAVRGMPVTGTVIMYILGPAIDRPITRWEEYFLPAPFSEDLDEIELGPGGQPLVENKVVLYERRGPPPGEKVVGIELAAVLVLAGLLGIGLLLPLLLGPRPVSRRLLGLGLFLWGLLVGFGGVVLLLFWTWTEHTDTHCNENLLVTPFLHLWLLGPGFVLLCKARLKQKTVKAIRWYLIGACGLILVDVLLKIGPFYQDNWSFILVTAAINALALAALIRSKPVALSPSAGTPRPAGR